jgi:hypothetical protein
LGDVQLATAPASSLHAKAGSLEVNVNVADAEPTVPEGPDVIDGTAVGAVLSIEYSWPVNDVVASVFWARSLIPVPFARFKPRLPSPPPVDALTVQEEPDPVTLEIDAPETPVGASAKFPLATPVTASLNVTVQETDAAFVGEAPARLIAVTDGFSVSIVQV